MKKSKVEIIQNKENPIPVEILADSIKEISEGMRQINKSKLNRIALLVLLKHSTGVSMKDLSLVLDSIASLEKDYCK